MRLDKTWIDTREPILLAEAVTQLCTRPVPSWDKDVHNHRHSIHTYHHELLDPVPTLKSDAIQPYATPQIIATSKSITTIHRAILKIYAEKKKLLTRLLIHAWVASTIRPDRIFAQKRPKKSGRCPHPIINLTYIQQHQPLRGSFTEALSSVIDQRQDCNYRVALLKVSLQATKRQQKSNLQLGLAQYFTHLVHNVFLSRREFWKALKPLRTGTPGRKVRAFSRTVPAVQNEKGDLYQDAEALADAWVSHFAQIEGGTAVHPSLIARLIQQERERIELKGYKGPLTHLPTRQQIELALRKTKTRSAPGPDGVSGDVLLLTRTWIAIQVTALTLKAALTLQTPLQSRGGQLFQLYKGKGSQSLMDKYRSILLADCVGKLSSRSYRTRFTPFIAQAMRDALTWQCGGVPGLGTDFPALTVRLTQHYAETTGKSIATIFVDAKSALYAVIRRLVMPMDQSDEDVARLFKDLHLPPEALHELAEALSLSQTLLQKQLLLPL